MKRTGTIIFCLFLLAGVKAAAQDYILMPENFFLHKGDKLDLHLLTANQFLKQDELNYEHAKTAKFLLYAGKKPIDLDALTKDNASPILSVPVENEGLNSIFMLRKTITDDIESDD